MSEMNKLLELVTIGRAGIDFNTTQLNTSFEYIDAYTKSIGGSPANIVQGAAKLGLKTAFIGKISGDGMGEYIYNDFQKQGINVSGLVIDKTGARNCLAILEILDIKNSGTYENKDTTGFHHGTYLYRENTADMLITPDEINEELISKTEYLLFSGTAFSAEPSRSAMFAAIEYAKKSNTKMVLDIDYRPFGWKNLTEASAVYQQVCAEMDIIIGNREEFDIVEYTVMPDNNDNSVSAKTFLDMGIEIVVVKDGERGSWTYTQDNQVIECGVIKTEIKKTFGSGDAFAAGFMYGLIRNKGLSYAMQLGSACASIVLQGYSCAPDMPSYEQAEKYRKINESMMLK